MPEQLWWCWSVAAFAGAIGWVGLTVLLTSETRAGAGATMVLNGSLYNLGAAVGAAAGGVLLASGGFDALAIGLPLFGLASAACVAMRPAGENAATTGSNRLATPH